MFTSVDTAPCLFYLSNEHQFCTSKSYEKGKNSRNQPSGEYPQVGICNIIRIATRSGLRSSGPLYSLTMFSLVPPPVRRFCSLLSVLCHTALEIRYNLHQAFVGA
jgi:hypothetical protein